MAMRETTAISWNCCSCRSLTAGFDLRNSGTCSNGAFSHPSRSNQLAAVGKIERVRLAGPAVPILPYDQLVSTLQSVHPGEHQQGDFHGALSGLSGSNVEHFTAAQERDGEA
jgi:hypothetical protein